VEAKTEIFEEPQRRKQKPKRSQKYVPEPDPWFPALDYYKQQAQLILEEVHDFLHFYLYEVITVIGTFLPVLIFMVLCLKPGEGYEDDQNIEVVRRLKKAEERKRADKGGGDGSKNKARKESSEKNKIGKQS